MIISYHVLRGFILCIILFCHAVHASVKADFPIPAGFGTVKEPQEEITFPTYQVNSSYFILGGLVSLTSSISGRPVASAIQRLEAFRCTIKFVNTLPNFLGNTQVVYQVYDTQNMPSEATSAALTLVQNKNVISVIGKWCIPLQGSPARSCLMFLFRIGPGTTDQSLQVVNLLNNYNMSIVSYGATGGLDEFVGSDTFARTTFSDDLEMQAIFALLQALNWTLVVPIFTNDTYGTSFQTLFNAMLDKNPWLNTTCFSTIPYSDSIASYEASQPALVEVSDCVGNQTLAKVVILFSN